MIGDKLIIEEHHTERAAEICELLAERIQDQTRFTMTRAVSVFRSLANHRANASRLPDVLFGIVFHSAESNMSFEPVMPLSTPGVTESSGDWSEPADKICTGSAFPIRFPRGGILNTVIVDL